MSAQTKAAGGEPVNEVRLVGRISQQPEERVLPSGDSVWVFRVVVVRTGDRRAGGRPRVRGVYASPTARAGDNLAVATPTTIGTPRRHEDEAPGHRVPTRRSLGCFDSTQLPRHAGLRERTWNDRLTFQTPQALVACDEDGR